MGQPGPAMSDPGEIVACPECDLLQRLPQLEPGAKAERGGRKPGKAAAYACPMHPDVARDGPGRCPRCGMDLVKRK